MKILYLGDVMGEAGMRAVEKLLPEVVLDHKIDIVIAQSENVSNGRGMTPADMLRLRAAGVTASTGGNHSLDNLDLEPLLRDPNSSVIAPANMHNNPGNGVYHLQSAEGEVVVISILGTILKANPPAMNNPLQTIDAILSSLKQKPAAIVINYHGDYSSEKRAFGYFVDGRVSLAVGDHWHVPTADAQILPNGTAYITDVGMCGTLHSILGVKTSNIIARMRDEKKNGNDLETEGPLQINGVLAEIDPLTGLATKITQVLQTS